MFELDTLVWLIPTMPLFAAVLTAVLGPRVLREQSHLPAIVGIGVAFVFSMLLLWEVRGTTPAADEIGVEHIVTLWTWADVGFGQAAPTTPEFRIDVALRSDPLTSIMLVMVTLISLLVAIYSSGYMHGDRGYWRFFSYINLFVFSMTMLVSVSNFLLLVCLLGGGWRLQLFADWLLVHQGIGSGGGKESVLGQSSGRFRLLGRAVPDLDHLWLVELPRCRRRHGRAGAGSVGGTDGLYWRRSGDGHLFVLDAGSVRQERPVPVARLAGRRHGGTDTRQRADPCGNDGHRRGLHGDALHAAVHGVARMRK